MRLKQAKSQLSFYHISTNLFAAVLVQETPQIVPKFDQQQDVPAIESVVAVGKGSGDGTVPYVSLRHSASWDETTGQTTYDPAAVRHQICFFFPAQSVVLLVCCSTGLLFFKIFAKYSLQNSLQ